MKIASSMYQGSMATELYDDRANDLGISEDVDVIEYEIDDNGSVHQLNQKKISTGCEFSVSAYFFMYL